MEENFLKNDLFAAEYRFTRDLVTAVFEMRALYVSDFRIQHDKSFFSVAQRIKVKDLFSKEWPKLDEHIKMHTYENGKSEYGDKQFSLCVAKFVEKYKPENKSEDDFLLVCSRIAYVAAYFLRNNSESDTVSLAVNCVYKILINTFYSTTITETKLVFKNIQDRKYRYAYYLVKTLVEMRGVTVPDLELIDHNNLLFTDEHKDKIKMLFGQEYSVLDELVKSFICKDGHFSYTDENLSKCMDEIVRNFESETKTEDGFVSVCARLAYAAAWCLRKNNSSNVTKLVVSRIFQMVIYKIHSNKYKLDGDYRFAYDLVKMVAGMRNYPLTITKMPHSGISFFMIAHRNKIDELLSREKPYLEEVIKKFTNEDENMNFNDVQFLQVVEQVTGDYKCGYKSKEQMVCACVRIAYTAACFSRANNKSNAPALAIDRMLEIVKDIHALPKSKDEDIRLINPQDDHYRFAYDLVKTVLELKSIPVSDPHLPDPDNFLFTATHRKNIENMFSKELTKLDKMVDKLAIKQGFLDYSDSNFLQCIHQIIKEYHHHQNTEEELVYVCARIAHLSSCFLTANFKSNATILAVNRIYELTKSTECFSNLTDEEEHILKFQDDHYCFVYDLAKTVFEIMGILVSSIDTSKSDYVFMDIDRDKIQDLLSKERFQLDELIEKVTNKGGRIDYSDNKFLYCMDLIGKVYQSDETDGKEYLNIFVKISYTAASFLIKNSRSNATFLAVNRMYEMSKDLFHLDKTAEKVLIEEENCQLAYDLIKATLQICSNSLKLETPISSDSSIPEELRDAIQDILSKEWPCLHQLIRRFTKRCAGITFSEGNFLHCIQQIKNDYELKMKSEDALVLVSSRIAYVAICLPRKNRKSSVSDLAVDIIYRMRKDFYRFRTVK